MSDAPNKHQERLDSAYMAGAKKAPKLVCSRLYQVGPQPLDAVPSDGDGSAGTKSQCTVSAREQDHSQVDQRLKRVQ